MPVPLAPRQATCRPIAMLRPARSPDSCHRGRTPLSGLPNPEVADPSPADRSVMDQSRSVPPELRAFEPIVKMVPSGRSTMSLSASTTVSFGSTQRFDYAVRIKCRIEVSHGQDDSRLQKFDPLPVRTGPSTTPMRFDSRRTKTSPPSSRSAKHQTTLPHQAVIHGGISFGIPARSRGTSCWGRASPNHSRISLRVRNLPEVGMDDVAPICGTTRGLARCTLSGLGPRTRSRGASGENTCGSAKNRWTTPARLPRVGK